MKYSMRRNIAITLFSSMAVLCANLSLAVEQKRPFNAFLGYTIEGTYPLADISDKTKILDIKVPCPYKPSEFRTCTLHLNPVSGVVVGITALSDKIMGCDEARICVKKIADDVVAEFGKEMKFSENGLQCDCRYARQMKKSRALKPADTIKDEVRVRINSLDNDGLTHVMISAWSETLECECVKEIAQSKERLIHREYGKCSDVLGDGRLKINTNGGCVVVGLDMIRFPSKVLFPDDFNRARKALGDMVLNAPVYFEYVINRGEKIGVVWAHGWLEVNLQLVSMGLVYRDISAETDIAYSHIEKGAQSLGLGIWNLDKKK